MIPLSILELGRVRQALIAELLSMMPGHMRSRLNVWDTNAYG